MHVRVRVCMRACLRVSVRVRVCGWCVCIEGVCVSVCVYMRACMFLSFKMKFVGADSVAPAEEPFVIALVPLAPLESQLGR